MTSLPIIPFSVSAIFLGVQEHNSTMEGESKHFRNFFNMYVQRYNRHYPFWWHISSSKLTKRIKNLSRYHANISASCGEELILTPQLPDLAGEVVMSQHGVKVGFTVKGRLNIYLMVLQFA